MDTYHDEEMNKLQNWLLYGLSSSDIYGSALTDSFSDSFLVISKDGLQVYTNSQGFKELSYLATIITNCNIYTITKSDENDSEKQEVIKVGKFYEMVHDKKIIGMPVRIVYDEIDRFNTHYYDNFFAFNKDTPQKRQERTEQDLIDSFWLRYEFSLLSRKISNIPFQEDELPLPRTLIGKNTNKYFKEISNKEERLYKYNLNGKTAQHFTVEFAEKNTNIRFARTYFLTNLSQHYMNNYQFSDEEEERQPSYQGKINENNARFLFNAYISLLLTYQTISQQILQNQIQNEEVQGQAFSVFSKYLLHRTGQEDIQQIQPQGKDSFSVHIKTYNTYGQEQINSGQKLIVIRMQASDLTSPFDKSDLGSILFAQTFFKINNDVHINITKNIPNLQCWYTTNKHYEHLPIQIQTEKNIQCERLGDKVNYYQDLIGLLPIKQQYNELFQDFILNGKLVFYEKGFIFVDNKLNNIVFSYEDIEHLYFYFADELVLEIKTKQQQSLPANMLCGDTFYLKLNQSIVNEKFKTLQQYFESNQIDCKIEKKYEPCQYLQESLSMKNYIVNQKYNKFYSCDYLNFQFVEEEYREILEYQVINEFNTLRGKEFISYNQFHNIYQDAKQNPKTINYTQQFITNLNTKQSDKINVIIVSGIPGSGKLKLAQFLTTQLQNENLLAQCFKFPNIEDTDKFNINMFINYMMELRKQHQSTQIILAILPSYHHLKKVIFQLKKDEEFSKLFDIKHIITKVFARNFYMNKNRNTYQFLIENCMKGISQAIIFEKSNVNQNEVQLMEKQLSNANFEQNVLYTHGRTFQLEDLAKILINNNEKLNIVYSKYFYGFEKEGKSQYFLEKQVQGAYFNYRYPIREDLLTNTIMLALNVPISNVDFLLPQSVKKEKDEESELKIREDMSKEEKRKIEKEIKQKQKIEADLEPERLLREEMDITKRKIHSNDLYLERIRGFVLVEGKEEEQDYELVCNFNEVSLKPLKNQNNRIEHEQLGIQVYGKNLNEKMVKEVLKTCRTQLSQKQILKTRDNITKEEIEMIKEKHISDNLPEGWFFNGYLYLDIDGKTQTEHPNLELLIKNYIDEQNGIIGEHNREVQKEWRNDFKKYDIPTQ